MIGCRGSWSNQVIGLSLSSKVRILLPCSSKEDRLVIAKKRFPELSIAMPSGVEHVSPRSANNVGFIVLEVSSLYVNSCLAFGVITVLGDVVMFLFEVYLLGLGTFSLIIAVAFSLIARKPAIAFPFSLFSVISQ